MSAVKKSIWIQGLALTGVLAGIANWLLRWRLLAAGADEKGLLLPGQPLAIISWILTACVVALVAVCLWKHRNVKISVGRSPLCEALRLLAMVLAAYLFRGQSLLGKAAAVAALAAAAATLWTLLQGKKQPHPAVADIPTVLFFLLSLLCCYQVWSAEPEMQRYFYPLLSLVCLMIATYSRSALACGVGKTAAFLGTGLLGVYFGFSAGADPGYPVLFPLMGLWLFTQLGMVTEE